MGICLRISLLLTSNRLRFWRDYELGTNSLGTYRFLCIRLHFGLYSNRFFRFIPQKRCCGNLCRNRSCLRHKIYKPYYFRNNFVCKLVPRELEHLPLLNLLQRRICFLKLSLQWWHPQFYSSCLK